MEIIAASCQRNIGVTYSFMYNKDIVYVALHRAVNFNIGGFYMDELSDVFLVIPNDYSLDKQTEVREYLTDLLRLSLIPCVSLKHVIKIKSPHYIYSVISPSEYSVCRIGFQFSGSCIKEKCAIKVEEALVNEGFLIIGIRDGY